MIAPSATVEATARSTSWLTLVMALESSSGGSIRAISRKPGSRRSRLGAILSPRLLSGRNCSTSRASEPTTKPTASASTPNRGPKPAAAMIMTMLNGMPWAPAQPKRPCAWPTPARRLVPETSTVAISTTRVSRTASSVCSGPKPGASTPTTGAAKIAITSPASPSTTIVTVTATSTVRCPEQEPVVEQPFAWRATTGVMERAIAPEMRPSTMFMTPWATR